MIRGFLILTALVFCASCQKSTSIDLGGNTNGSDEALIKPVQPPGSLDSTEIGNGGDLIQCSPSAPRFQLPYDQGWYILDFVEDRGPRPQKDYLKFETLQDYFVHLKQILSKIDHQHLNSFESFLERVPFFEQEHLTLPAQDVERLWIAKEQNEEIHDENPSYIPLNCRVRNRNRQLKLHQVVVRQEFVNEENEIKKVEYSFDPVLVEKLNGRSLQVSMLIVHEWLWDFFPADQGPALRRANRALHAQDSVELSPERLEILLNLREAPPVRPRPRF